MDKRTKIVLIVISVVIGLVGFYAIVNDIVKRTTSECEVCNVDEIRQNALKDGMQDMIDVVRNGNRVIVEGGFIAFIPVEE